MTALARAVGAVVLAGIGVGLVLVVLGVSEGLSAFTGGLVSFVLAVPLVGEELQRMGSGR